MGALVHNHSRQHLSIAQKPKGGHPNSPVIPLLDVCLTQELCLTHLQRETGRIMFLACNILETAKTNGNKYSPTGEIYSNDSQLLNSIYNALGIFKCFMAIKLFNLPINSVR